MLHDSRNLHQRKAACSSRVVISSHWRAFEGWQAGLSPVPQKQKKDHRQGLPRHCFSLRSSSEGFTAELCQSLVPAHTIRTRLLLCIPFSAPLNPVQCLWTEIWVVLLRQCWHKRPLKNYWQIDKERLNSESFAKWSHYSHKKVMKYDKSSEKDNMYDFLFFAANGQFDVFY